MKPKLANVRLAFTGVAVAAPTGPQNVTVCKNMFPTMLGLSSKNFPAPECDNVQEAFLEVEALNQNIAFGTRNGKAEGR